MLFACVAVIKIKFKNEDSNCILESYNSELNDNKGSKQGLITQQDVWV